MPLIFGFILPPGYEIDQANKKFGPMKLDEGDPGYDREFSYLDGDYPGLGHANVRGIYKEDDVSVGFVGYVRPSIGELSGSIRESSDPDDVS